jgi:hypothetical protein
MSSTAKKLTVLICILGLLGALVATPALAGKKKKGTFAAESPVPWPAGDGCNEGEEGVSKTTEAMKAPFDAVLTVTMENFQGDWDLFVTDADGNALASSVESQLTGSAATEEVTILLKKGYAFGMVACNWGGGPSADVSWTLAGK